LHDAPGEQPAAQVRAEVVAAAAACGVGIRVRNRLSPSAANTLTPANSCSGSPAHGGSKPVSPPCPLRAFGGQQVQRRDGLAELASQPVPVCGGSAALQP
jgi:hypothetical protein